MEGERRRRMRESFVLPALVVALLAGPAMATSPLQIADSLGRSLGLVFQVDSHTFDMNAGDVAEVTIAWDPSVGSLHAFAKHVSPDRPGGCNVNLGLAECFVKGTQAGFAHSCESREGNSLTGTSPIHLRLVAPEDGEAWLNIDGGIIQDRLPYTATISVNGGIPTNFRTWEETLRVGGGAGFDNQAPFCQD